MEEPEEESQLMFEYRYHNQQGDEILYLVKMYRVYEDCRNKLFDEEFTRTELEELGLKVRVVGDVEDEGMVLRVLHHYFQYKKPQKMQAGLKYIPEYAPYVRREKIKKALGH
jgi:hypothetical protein